MLDGTVSASLDGKIEGGRQEVVAEHPQQVKRLLSEEQQAPADEWLLPLDEVQLLGPVRAAMWRPGTGQLGDITAELWEVGDRLRFLELSVLAEDDPLGHQQRLDDTIRSHALEVDPEAETKSRMWSTTRRPGRPCTRTWNRLGRGPRQKRLCKWPGWALGKDSTSSSFRVTWHRPGPSWSRTARCATSTRTCPSPEAAFLVGSPNRPVSDTTNAAGHRADRSPHSSTTGRPGRDATWDGMLCCL